MSDSTNDEFHDGGAAASGDPYAEADIQDWGPSGENFDDEPSVEDMPAVDDSPIIGEGDGAVSQDTMPVGQEVDAQESLAGTETPLDDSVTETSAHESVSNTENDEVSVARVTDEERIALEGLAAARGAHSPQAQIILEWADGLDVAEIAGRVRLSANTVARHIRAFETRRMGAFTKAPARRSKPARSEEKEPIDRITVEEMCRRYDVDLRHATHVAELAHQLFALTLPLHHLDERYLDVIYVAGLLHNVAYASDPKKHHSRGRDLILGTPLSNVSDADRAIIAAITAFHRKSWTPDRLEKERSYTSLSATVQPVALWLSAILRIADGLDYSQSQSTTLTESMIGKEVCLLGVRGPQDKIDRSRANTKADMWRSVTGVSLSVVSRKDVRQALRRRVTQRPEPVHISASDAMSEAGRALLYFHLRRMLYHEPGTRSGANPESVHDMRVAVRRMTAALDVFGGSYKGKTRRSIQRELQILEDALGAVRDLEVNVEQAQTYLKTLPADARPDLEQMIADWKNERETNQGRLLRYLDSQRYAEFAERFLEFGETPEANVARANGRSSTPITVAYTAPAIVYIRYEAVRAYEPVIHEAPIETFHELRAEAKRMRYTLEFFRDVLGPEARDLIALLVRVQDHLGALQDADIASALIQKYIKREVKKARKESQDAEPVDISTRLYGINAYLDSRQHQIETARKTFGPLWAEVISAETRQMLGRSVGVL